MYTMSPFWKSVTRSATVVQNFYMIIYIRQLLSIFKISTCKTILMSTNTSQEFAYIYTQTYDEI